MIVGYGVTVPKGSLPVFSVDSEEEAERLLVLACETTSQGEYVARELATEQTIENLTMFSLRLSETYERCKDWITTRERDDE